METNAKETKATEDTKETPEKEAKKNLISASAVFAISLLFLGAAIFCLVFALNFAEDGDGFDQWLGAALNLFAFFLIFMFVLHLVIRSYGGENRFGKFLYGFSFVFYFVAKYIVFGVVLLVMAIVRVFKESPAYTTSVKAKDEDGNEHTLTSTYGGSSTYKDENGNYWTTNDGETFKRS